MDDFSNKDLLIALLKISANNNAKLQLALQNIYEIRKSALNIETTIINKNMDVVVQPMLNELMADVMQEIENVNIGENIEDVLKWALPSNAV